jgi:hypothetical protein
MRPIEHLDVEGECVAVVARRGDGLDAAHMERPLGLLVVALAQVVLADAPDLIRVITSLLRDGDGRPSAVRAAWGTYVWVLFRILQPFLPLALHGCSSVLQYHWPSEMPQTLAPMKTAAHRPQFCGA